MPPKKEATGPTLSDALEAELAEIVDGRHGERRILLAMLRTLIAILKTLEAR